MLAETKHTPLRLAAAILLLLALLTACVSKSAQAQEKIDLGQKYLTEMNYTEAVASFTEAIELDPDSIPAYMGRAEAYVGLEQYPEAKADYTTAIEKAADQPYTQAQAYVGRAEVNELTEELQDAESDYEAAQELLEAENIAEKEPVEDDMLTALKKKILYARAAVCIKLGLYDGAVTSYEKLNALGEDVTEEHTRVLNAALWAISTTQDLGAANQWLKTHDLPQGDEVAQALRQIVRKSSDAQKETVQVTNNRLYTSGIFMAQDGQLFSSGENSYEQQCNSYRLWLTINHDAITTLLSDGFAVKVDCGDGRMVAIYTDESPTAEVSQSTAEAFVQAYSDPDARKKNIASDASWYLYDGQCDKNFLRQGDGVWYISNAAADDWEMAHYRWDADAPVGGYLKKVSRTTTEHYDDLDGSVRNTQIDYSIGGYQIVLHETWSGGLVYDTYVELMDPILDADLGESWGTFFLPAGTVMASDAELWSDQTGWTMEKLTLQAGERCQYNYAAVGSYGMIFEGR